MATSTTTTRPPTRLTTAKRGLRIEDDGLPYARYAFWNPYNVSLFLGGVILGAATGHGWLSVLTCAAEVMWMILAPDSRLLRALWFDRVFAAEKKLGEVVKITVKSTSRAQDLLYRMNSLRRLQDAQNPKNTQARFVYRISRSGRSATRFKRRPVECC